jgi:hypothetical protein
LDAVTVGNKFHIAEDAQRGADALARFVVENLEDE